MFHSDGISNIYQALLIGRRSVRVEICSCGTVLKQAQKIERRQMENDKYIVRPVIAITKRRNRYENLEHYRISLILKPQAGKPTKGLQP